MTRITLLMALALVVLGPCYVSEAAGFADVYCEKTASAATPFHTVDMEGGLTPLTVTVFNFAHVGAADMTAAESFVDQIYRQAGVTIDWLDACQGNESVGLRLNILPIRRHLGDSALARRSLAIRQQSRVATTELGFADPGGETATILYRSVTDVAFRDGVGTTYVLALVIAHELGHVLIGPGAHSLCGIMKPMLDPHPDTGASLLFSLKQAATIRRSIETRDRKPSEF